jgi:hypothetical protein
VIYPEGSAHDSARLSAGDYLELVSVVDRDTMLKTRPWMVLFLDKQEGARSAAFEIASAEAAAARMRTAGIAASIFTLVRKPGAPPVLLVTPKLPHLPEGSVFFVQYPPGTAPITQVTQPNTATGLVSAWIVVSDVRRAGLDLESIGFRRVRDVTSSVIGGSGSEYAAQRGSIVLLGASRTPAPVATFNSQRGEGVMGISVRVADLDAAKSYAAARMGHEPLVALTLA